MRKAASKAPADSPPAVKATISSPDRVAAAITKGVLRREYMVGQRLVESELTIQLKVSRSTVREALKILAVSGVVEIFPHRGAVIRSLSLVDARCLLDVLEGLIGLAARSAAEKIGRDKNRQMFTVSARPLIEISPTQDFARILDERARFYQTMLEIADNPELNRAMPLARAHLFRSQFDSFLSKPDLTAMVSEYRNISHAILAGDGKKAEMYARRHIQKTGERTLPHLR